MKNKSFNDDKDISAGEYIFIIFVAALILYSLCNLLELFLSGIIAAAFGSNFK